MHSRPDHRLFLARSSRNSEGAHPIYGCAPSLLKLLRLQIAWANRSDRLIDNAGARGGSCYGAVHHDILAIHAAVAVAADGVRADTLLTGRGNVFRAGLLQDVLGTRDLV